MLCGVVFWLVLQLCCLLISIICSRCECCLIFRICSLLVVRVSVAELLSSVTFVNFGFLI